MNQPRPPVACTLSTPELREREATLVKEFKAGVLEITELADGYSFRLDADAIVLASRLIVAERECCRFLTLQLIAEADRGAVVLKLTGPEGTKEFLRAVFVDDEKTSAELVPTIR